MRIRSSVLRQALAGTRFRVALEEENTTGKVAKEIEHMFYGRVDSMDTLLKAECMEVQEQWGLWQDKTSLNAACGSVRIRKNIRFLIVNGVVQKEQPTTQYVMTTKVKTLDGHALEVSIETTEDNFKQFKLLAESGMIKHRYTFPIPNSELKWEVDAFVMPGENVMSNRYQNYVKVDLEVESMDEPIPAAPPGVLDMFNAKLGDEATPEQKQIIAKMKEYLNQPNVYVQQVYTGI